MDIYYETWGQGPAVICLHDVFENRKVFAALAKDLQKHYQLILIDTRYHGKSVKSGPLSIAQNVLDVQSVIADLGLESYDVIGVGMGANTALALATQDQRLKSAVLISPYSSPQSFKGFYYFQIVMTLIFMVPFCLYNKLARRRFQLTKWLLREPHFSSEMFASIKQPILVLAGDRDKIKPSAIEKIAKCLPHCVQEELYDSHDALHDAYRQVLKKIRGYLYASNQTNTND